MNLEKIGKFICDKRKEKGMTQLDLANLINVKSKTISKWETGHGLPDVSLMMPLCNELDISVNELLSGEKLNNNLYQEKAEDNIVNLLSEKEQNIKNYIISIIMVLISFIPSLALMIYVEELDASPSLSVIAGIISISSIAVGIIVATIICIKSGYYECPLCGERFKPTAKEYIMGPHSFRTRYLRCPCCGETSMCKLKFSRK